MDKRFLQSLYKQELHLKITSLSQKNINVVEYIIEFEQLQMRFALKQEPTLKIARFIEELLPNIANKVYL